MMKIKKLILAFAVLFFLTGAVAPGVYAQGILPRVSSNAPCDKYENLDQFEKDIFTKKETFEKFLKEQRTKGVGQPTLRNLLGCAVKLGRIRLYMVPFFITYLIQFLLSLAGILAVLFVVYGGFKYMLGGLTEDKESGKKIILHALIGLVVALSGWIAVNLIQVALTS